MRKMILILAGIFLVMPLVSYATWQVADSFHGTQLNRDLQPAASVNVSDFPSQYKSTPAFSFYTFKGWLKSNLVKMAKVQGWTVNWKAFRNYDVLIATEIAGSSFPDTANQLLSHYPLRAYYNRGMCIVTVVDK